MRLDHGISGDLGPINPVAGGELSTGVKGCVYFRTTAKPRQTNSLSESAARLDGEKGRGYEDIPGVVGQCCRSELASLANLVIARRESFSKRASVDLSFRYCLDAAWKRGAASAVKRTLTVFPCSL